MKEIATRILALIKEQNLSYGELAHITGIPKSALQRYATGETQKVPLDRVEIIAAALKTTPAYLMCWTDDPDANAQKSPLAIEDFGGFEVDAWASVPILGTVKAGPDGVATEEIEGFEMLPAQWVQDGANNYFLLRVVGDSMTPRFVPGDLLLVKRQKSVDNGSLAIVIVNGEEGMVKRVFYETEWIHLVSENPAYPPRVFTGAAVLEVYVVGKVVSLIRKEV